MQFTDPTLEKARRKHRRDYDRGFILSQKGEDERGQRILDKANRELAAAEAAAKIRLGG